MAYLHLSDNPARSNLLTAMAARADDLLNRIAGGSLWRTYSVVGVAIFLIMGATMLLSVV